MASVPRGRGHQPHREVQRRKKAPRVQNLLPLSLLEGPGAEPQAEGRGAASPWPLPLPGPLRCRDRQAAAVFRALHVSLETGLATATTGCCPSLPPARPNPLRPLAHSTRELEPPE